MTDHRSLAAYRARVDAAEFARSRAHPVHLDNGDEARRVDLKFKAQFTPLALGGAGTFELPLVFAGYGITAPDADYDDFKDRLS